MKNLDDTLLMSYVDGELDAETASEVESALSEDRARQARVRALREDSALVRAAFNHVLFDAPADVIRLGARVRKPSHRGWMPLAMAASVAMLALGLGVGMGVSGLNDRTAEQLLDVRASAFQHALEHNSSGAAMEWGAKDDAHRGRVMAVSSYRNASGRYCREFEERRAGPDGPAVEAGVACREDDGTWRVRVRYYP
jgi:anti-sigma factor RsiW